MKRMFDEKQLGGGVLPNNGEEGTEELKTLKIDDINYKLGGGGLTEIWKGYLSFNVQNEFPLDKEILDQFKTKDILLYVEIEDSGNDCLTYILGHRESPTSIFFIKGYTPIIVNKTFYSGAIRIVYNNNKLFCNEKTISQLFINPDNTIKAKTTTCGVLLKGIYSL